MEANLNLQNQIKIENITQRTISIIGGKGSGKSSTLKLILDEFKPTLIFDPIGTLRHQDMIRIRITKSAISKAREAAQKINLVIRQKENVIISFQEMLQVELNEFMDHFIPALKIKDAMIAFDEAHEFVPQSGFSSPEVERYIRFCRNYNVGTIMTSQRPATVNKNVLALTDYLILYRLTWTNDIKVVKDLLSISQPKQTVNAILKKTQSQKYLEGVKVDFLNPGSNLNSNPTSDSWHTQEEKKIISEMGGTPLTKYGTDGELNGKPVEVRSIRDKREKRYRLMKTTHDELLKNDGSYIFVLSGDAKIMDAKKVDKILKDKKRNWYKDRDYPHTFIRINEIGF